MAEHEGRLEAGIEEEGIGALEDDECEKIGTEGGGDRHTR